MAHQQTDYRTTHSSNSGSAALAFVVGGLVVLVAVIAYVIFGTNGDIVRDASQPANIEINTSADSAAGAEATEDGADSAAAAQAESGSADASAGAAASDTN